MKQSFERFYPLVTFLFACLLYANTIPNTYNLDDELVTIEHRTTSKGFSGFKEIVTSFYYEDEMGYKYGYRPVTHISFAIEHQFFGDNPHVSHFINLLLYGVLCLLIYWLAKIMVPKKGALFALVVALVFAAHPLHTEVVASIKNRDEILSLLFGILAFITVFKLDAQESFSKRIGHLVLAIIFFYLGVLSKGSIMSLAILIPLALLLFRPKATLVFPILFYACTAMLGFYFNVEEFSWLLLSTLFLGGLILLLFAKIMVANLWKPVVDKALIFNNKFIKLSANSLMFLAAFGYFILSYLVAAYFQLLLVFYVAQVPLLFFVLRKKVTVTPFVGMVVFLSLSSLELFLLDLDFLYLGILFYLFAFEKQLQVKKILYAIPLAVFAIVIGFLTNSYWDVFEIAVLYLSLSIFSIWWIVIIKYLLILESFGYGLVVWLGYILLLIPNVTAIFKTIKAGEFLKKIRIGILFVTLFFMVLDSGVFNWTVGNTIAGEPALQEMVDIYEQEPEIDGLDRPILYMENPMVENWNWESRIANSATTIVFYTKKLLLPFPLLSYYGYDVVQLYSLEDTFAWISLGLIFLLACLSIGLLIKKKIVPSFGVAFMLIALIPYANLFTPVAGIVADRLAFVASFGFALLFAFVLFLIQNKKLMVLFFAVIVGFFSVKTVQRNFDWKDNLTLFEHDIVHLEKSAQANALLGYEYMRLSVTENQKENRNKAIVCFKQANTIYPNYLNWQFDLGRIYFESNEWDKAEENFEQAAFLDSSYSETYLYLMNIAQEQKEYDKVIDYAKVLVARDMANVTVWFALSEAYYFTENYAKVIEANDQILLTNNTIPEAYLNKAYAYVELRDFAACSEMINAAKRIAPNHLDIEIVEQMLLNSQ